MLCNGMIWLVQRIVTFMANFVPGRVPVYPKKNTTYSVRIPSTARDCGCMGMGAVLDDLGYIKAFCLVLVQVVVTIGRVEDYF